MPAGARPAGRTPRARYGSGTQTRPEFAEPMAARHRAQPGGDGGHAAGGRGLGSGRDGSTMLIGGLYPGLGKRSDTPPMPGFGRAPARCLPAVAGRQIAVARRSFRGWAGNRSQRHFSNIQARIIQQPAMAGSPLRRRRESIRVSGPLRTRHPSDSSCRSCPAGHRRPGQRTSPRVRRRAPPCCRRPRC